MYKARSQYHQQLQNVPSLTRGNADGQLWPLWPWKIGQIKNLEYIWCPLARSTSHKNLSKIGQVLWALLHFFYFHIMPPGGQTGKDMRPQFGLWVEATQMYICRKLEVNTISGYKTCRHLLGAMPMANFDLCDLEKKVKLKTRRICDVPSLEIPPIKIWAKSVKYYGRYRIFCVFGFSPLVAGRRIRPDRNLLSEVMWPRS